MFELYNRDGQKLANETQDATHLEQRRVARTAIGQTTISTVFLAGIDHEWRPGHPPLLFETMIFGGPHDQELVRYSTEEEALRGHLTTLDRIRQGKTPFEHLETAHGDN